VDPQARAGLFQLIDGGKNFAPARGIVAGEGFAARFKGGSV